MIILCNIFGNIEYLQYPERGTGSWLDFGFLIFLWQLNRPMRVFQSLNQFYRLINLVVGKNDQKNTLAFFGQNFFKRFSRHSKQPGGFGEPGRVGANGVIVANFNLNIPNRQNRRHQPKEPVLKINRF